MSAPGVDLDLADLLVMNESLGRFVTEFENIGDTTSGVQDAVGRPAGDGRLRDKVGDFESGWDGNREVVLESLQNVHDHITGVIEGFSQADIDMAKGGEA
ncbi:hypothetical protein [Microbacterium sp. CFBP9034]|uniref:hypothetical protein n=1 Tax=Microbacterium sp. CFBP9034 TaxID=3096540 RepID=UPI002A6AB046|nr:hypothetical protein [Microbacterium sp. CFBP9034]MDY0910323.1 hypothetical protein [Microbacterium sp. CFBP9034]